MTRVQNQVRHGNGGGQCEIAEIHGILKSDSIPWERKFVNIYRVYTFYVSRAKLTCQDFGACLGSFYVVGLWIVLTLTLTSKYRPIVGADFHSSRRTCLGDDVRMFLRSSFSPCIHSRHPRQLRSFTVPHCMQKHQGSKFQRFHGLHSKILGPTS